MDCAAWLVWVRGSLGAVGRWDGLGCVGVQSGRFGVRVVNRVVCLRGGVVMVWGRVRDGFGSGMGVWWAY